MSLSQVEEVLRDGRGQASTPSPEVPVAAALRMPPVQLGHVRALELLEQPEALRETARLYRGQLGHEVYFRPTGQGLTVLSLDPDATAMVGVGSLDALLPSRALLERQLAAYRTALSGQRRDSVEERLSVRWLASALTNGLALPGTPFHLVCQEWRFPLSPAGAERLDVLAVDVRSSELVVIELKSTSRSPGVRGTPLQQAQRHARWLYQGRQYFTPYFQRLARAMAVAYEGPVAMTLLELRDSSAPTARVYLGDGRPA